MSSYTYTLINPHNGSLAFRAVSLDNHPALECLQRVNYFSLILITEGEGKLLAGFSEYDFSKNYLLCFAPYQPFMLTGKGCRGFVINFHPDFFCIHKHHSEIACNGILFNDIYRPPFHEMDVAEIQKLQSIIGDMQEELQQEGVAQSELLISLLKIFLITASRSRAQLLSKAESLTEDRPGNTEPFVLQKLKDAIEANYREKHSAGEYARMLNISSKALARIAKNHFNRTLTDMISERIIIEAKRELYLSAKPVKAIAYELGFDDEYHFSRFFKNKADIPPQVYRQQVGFARGEAI